MEQLSMKDLAERIRQALDSADLASYRELLTPDATWGAPDDDEWGCHSRDEILAWYRRGRARGIRARVTEVVGGAGTLLVGLRVSGNEDWPDGETDRWQVLTVRDGRVADIRGYDDRALAASRAGVTE